MDITAGNDFLSLYGQKAHLNVCPNLNGYGINGRLKLRIEGEYY
jgi:hypothetical protein